MVPDLQKELDDLKLLVPDLKVASIFSDDGLPIAEASFNESDINYSAVYNKGTILMRCVKAASEMIQHARIVAIHGNQGDRVFFRKINDDFNFIFVCPSIFNMDIFNRAIERTETRLQEMLKHLDRERISHHPGEPLSLKIVLLGMGGVGRTAYLYRLIHREMIYNTAMTIGVQYWEMRGTYCGIPVILRFWDFAGQDRWRNAGITRACVKGADGAMLFFDGSRLMTLTGLGKPELSLCRLGNPKCPTILVANKSDLVPGGEMDEVNRYCREFINEHKLDGCVWTSVKTGDGIDTALEILLEQVFKRRNLQVGSGGFVPEHSPPKAPAPEPEKAPNPPPPTSQDLLAKFEKIAKISQRIDMFDLAIILRITKEQLLEFLVDWGEQVSFKIDKDVIIVQDVDAFVSALDEIDQQFKEWSRKERTKDGKKL